MRKTILKLLLKNKCPKGDLEVFNTPTIYKISCIFVFYKRFDLMDNILHCLNSQNFIKNHYEIILVEDRGGTENGKDLVRKFEQMNISYFAPDKGWGKMGYMRNYGLSKSRGEIILFLDDDTVITDTQFLSKLYSESKNEKNVSAVIPRGLASYALIKGRYDYHDPYFFTNRCTAYKKSCLKQLKGFDSSFTGQEDVEFAIRFMASKFKAFESEELVYYHPPMIFTDSTKAESVGASFAGSKYNMLVKLLLLINGSRWILRFLLPGLKNRHMARFAMGFLKGFIYQLTNKKQNIEYR